MKRLEVLKRQLASSSSAQEYIAGNSVSPLIVVVGGAVLDVQAIATSSNILRGGSVPGKIRQVPGGVGRNIAEGLGRMLARPPEFHSNSHVSNLQLTNTAAAGVRDGDLEDQRHATRGEGVAPPAVAFLSAVGCDAAGRQLLDSLQEAGVDTSAVLRVRDMATPCVAIVFDRTGEVEACVADVAGLEAFMTAEVVRGAAAPLIPKARLVVVEANLSPAAIAEVCAAAAASRPPAAIFMEPVSVPKSRRLVGSLHHCDYVSPNAAELAAMADELRRRRGGADRELGDVEAYAATTTTIRAAGEKRAGFLSPRLLKDAAELIAGGARAVILTMGAGGVALVRRLPLPDSDGGATVAIDGGVLDFTQAHASRSSAPEPGSGSTPCYADVTLQVDHIDALAANVVNLSGAGDMLVAGTAAALTLGHPPVSALAFGVAAATRAVESGQNVPTDLRLEVLAAAAGKAATTQQRFVFRVRI